MLAERERPAYFCSTEVRGLPEASPIEPRVTEEFKDLLEAYKKEGLEG